MAMTTKILFRGAASTNTSTTLYTVPAATTAIVTNIAATNTSATDVNFTLSLGGVPLQSSTVVPANVTAYIDLKQVLEAGDTISGGASTTDVTFHISGVENA
jgi:polyisoprenoid-binding protein YceI